MDHCLWSDSYLGQFDALRPPFGEGLLPPNMESVKGGGILKIAERPTGVAFGVVLMMVGRSSPHIWLLWWVMAPAFFFGMIGGLGIPHLKCSIFSYMHVQMTRKLAFLMYCVIRRVEMIDFGIRDFIGTFTRGN